MASNNMKSKKMLIDKADTRMLVFAGIAAFVLVFTLVSGDSLINKASYQNRLATAKQVAVTQLKSDVSAESSLVNSYEKFVSSPINIIGGIGATGSGVNSGNNGQIILDALPSKYDFPAMITSVNSMLQSAGVKIDSISGTDNQVAQQAFQTSPAPTPIPLVFQFSVDGTYQNFQNLFDTFQRSIRPFKFDNVQITATTNANTKQTGLTLNATVETYYQSEKVFNLTSEVIK